MRIGVGNTQYSDVLIVAVLAAVALATLALGMAPTVLQLQRRAVAANLSEERG